MHWLFCFCFVVHLNAVLLGVPFAPSIVSEDLVTARLHRAQTAICCFCSGNSLKKTVTAAGNEDLGGTAAGSLFVHCFAHAEFTLKISIIALVRLKPDAGSKSQKLKSLWGGQILDCNCCKFDSQALKLLKFSSLNSRKKKFEVLYYHELELNREKHSVNAQPDSNRAVCC